MRPREAYFINEHTTFCKEQNLNFAEHQKILKTIKNSSQKMKKSETFPKISSQKISEKSENLKNLKNLKKI